MRTGPLFTGQAKNRLIDETNYLFHIVRYIHLNPVWAGLVVKPEDWAFSNYQELIGLRKGALFDAEFLKSNFGTAQEYKTFVETEIPIEFERKLEKYYLA